MRSFCAISISYSRCRVRWRPCVQNCHDTTRWENEAIKRLGIDWDVQLGSEMCACVEGIIINIDPNQAWTPPLLLENTNHLLQISHDHCCLLCVQPLSFWLSSKCRSSETVVFQLREVKDRKRMKQTAPWPNPNSHMQKVTCNTRILIVHAQIRPWHSFQLSTVWKIRSIVLVWCFPPAKYFFELNLLMEWFDMVSPWFFFYQQTKLHSRHLRFDKHCLPSAKCLFTNLLSFWLCHNRLLNDSIFVLENNFFNWQLIFGVLLSSVNYSIYYRYSS